jgi:hypothetical protein
MLQTVAERPTASGIKSLPYPTKKPLEGQWKRGTYSLRFQGAALKALNGFRFRLFSDICREISGLAGSRVRDAFVILESDPDDETKKALVLVIKVDANWENVHEWEYHLSQKIVEWSAGWSDGLWNDYIENVNYSVMPTSL